ncbi:putative sugar O-methyltransferase [Pseudazoarcus pumilus]|nr:putative sugar O-methyltransferase [Pseudazoarcus pumilus]
MHNTDAELDLLLRDMDEADPQYRPTAFWRTALDRLIPELGDGGLQRFRSLPGPLSFFVPTYGFPGIHTTPARFTPLRHALENLELGDRRCSIHLERLLTGEAQAESDYRVLCAADQPLRPPFLDQFSEGEAAAPIEQFEFDGRRFGRSSLNYLLGLAFLKRHCDLSEVRTVLEIGGGFGSLGEILLADKRNDVFYINADIPPTVHCAHHYLSTTHGRNSILGYAESRNEKVLDISAMRASHRAATLAAWQLPRLQGTVDLFVNFISFQEMEPDVVCNYLGQIKRLQARYILLRNLREGKAKATPGTVGVIDPIKGEMYDEFLGQSYRLVACNTVPFGYRTVDGFHSELRVYERR